MTSRKLNGFLFFSFLILSFSTSGQVQQSDLDAMIGYWKGSLTYMNYSDGREVTIKSNLEIKKGKKAFQLLANNLYPDEPKANSSYKIKVAKDGSLWNNNEVLSRKESSDGVITIVVIFSGKDNNKAAQIRNTYAITANTLLIRKEVKYSEEAEWFQRNIYEYVRGSS